MRFDRILAVLLVVVCLFAAVTVSQQPSSTPVPEPSATLTRERFFQNQNRIAVVSLQGPISADVGGFSPAATLPGRLRTLADDNKVKGVLVRINSPGGTVGASQEIYREIVALREKKPVVVAVSDLAASGGYYIASAADAIVANPGSLVGNIGVIIQGVDATELLGKIGVTPETIKTGPFKDLLSPTKPLSGEEREILQALVNNSFDQFITAVADGRQHLGERATQALPEAAIAKRKAMTADQVRQLADGRIYTGEQALEAGLIDRLGGYSEAVGILREWIGSRDIPVNDEIPSLDYFWRVFQSKAPLSQWVSESLGTQLLSNPTSLYSDPAVIAPVWWLSADMNLQAQWH